MPAKFDSEADLAEARLIQKRASIGPLLPLANVHTRADTTCNVGTGRFKNLGLSPACRRRPEFNAGRSSAPFLGAIQVGSYYC